MATEPPAGPGASENPPGRFRRLTPTFWVSSQLDLEDLAVAAAAGVRSIINNRPEGEAPDQTPGAAMAQASAALGLRYIAAPVSGRPDASAVAAVGEAIATSDDPILAYCRSGARSTFAWALAQLSLGVPREEVVARAAAAGYDLSAAL